MQQLREAVFDCLSISEESFKNQNQNKMEDQESKNQTIVWKEVKIMLRPKNCQ